MTDRIGFMQGRLSAPVGGAVQAFPWSRWKGEFARAQILGIHLMEWTLDRDRLYDNPLLRRSGREEITELSGIHGLGIPSVTGDCFMQAPFWKSQGTTGSALRRDFLAVAEACAGLGVATLVVPLVDNGRLETSTEEDALFGFLESEQSLFTENDLRVAFESDFAPEELRRFIECLDPSVFGINYDIGNSAALGLDPSEEMAAYGERIFNVHVKDRLRGGATVPLGLGDADFDTVFDELASVRYAGNYILQTARAGDGDDVGHLRRYHDMTLEWIGKHAA